MKNSKMVRLGEDLGGGIIDVAWLEGIVRDAIREVVHNYRVLRQPANTQTITEAVVTRLKSLYED